MVEHRMKRKCLVVGADKKTLQHVKEAASHWYDVLDTIDPEQSLKLLQSHSDVSVIITQHDSESFDSLTFLESVRASFPDIRRVVMTTYVDLSRIVQGLHSGTIQKLVQRPINPPELQQAIIPFVAQQSAALPSSVGQRLAG